MTSFRDRFDTDDNPHNTTGVYKLTSVGCMERFKIDRDDMMLTPAENRTRNWENSNRAEREERMLLGKVATLLKKGYKILPTDESLEEFVLRCQESTAWQGWE